jgi:hypothetical protein
MPPLVGAQIKLGGVERTLRFTTPALVRAQGQLGGSPLGETMAAVGRVSMRHITVMVWAGLLHEDKALKLEAVEELIEPPLEEVIGPILEALQPWIPRARAKGADESAAVEKKSSTSS